MKLPRWIATLAPAVLWPGILAAQAAHPEWGVSSSSAEVINAWDMQPSDGGAQWSYNFAGYRYLTAGGALFSGVHVPQGAKITAMVVDGCDASSDGGLTFTLLRGTSGEPVTLATIDTGAAAAPGCSLFAVDLPTPETADYNQYRYWIQGANQTGDGETVIGAVRIVYELQVSPAPGTATFDDVPTSDPGFQYVEALVASGVTAGCGSGNFCPDAPLTRRQMAVFLAKALGLHWPQ